MRSNIFLFSALLLPVILAGISDSALCQDYEALMRQYQQQDAELSARMRQTEQNIVQQNMQNPRVQEMYQQHLAAGGRSSFQDFAYSYGATGGFTQEGMKRWNESERNIQQRDQAAINDYRQNQQQNQQALTDMYNRQNEIAHQRGNLLNGTTDYVNPQTAQQYNLPHTAQPGAVLQDPSGGQTFRRDGLGNYQQGDNFGNWQDLEEDE